VNDPYQDIGLISFASFPANESISYSGQLVANLFNLFSFGLRANIKSASRV